MWRKNLRSVGKKVGMNLSIWFNDKARKMIGDGENFFLEEYVVSKKSYL